MKTKDKQSGFFDEGTAKERGKVEYKKKTRWRKVKRKKDACREWLEWGGVAGSDEPRVLTPGPPTGCDVPVDTKDAGG